MTQKMLYMAPILNIPRPIREDDTIRNVDQRQVLTEEKENEDDDLIFGALEDDNSSKEKLDIKTPSTDEGISLYAEVERTKKRERAGSSISTNEDDWENMLPITEGDGSFYPVNHLQSIHEKGSSEYNVGMSNFRAKHRLCRRSKTSTLGRWREAIKKAAHLKDPW